MLNAQYVILRELHLMQYTTRDFYHHRTYSTFHLERTVGFKNFPNILLHLNFNIVPHKIQLCFKIFNFRPILNKKKK